MTDAPPSPDTRDERGRELIDPFGPMAGLFEDLFGAPRTNTVHVTLEEASEGTEREVAIEQVFLCASCVGTHADDAPDGAELVTCRLCDGLGKRQVARGAMTMVERCDGCGGRGERPHCAACNDRRGQRGQAMVRVAVPAGSHHGDTLTVPGAGDPSPEGQEDAVVRVVIDEHPERLHREGDDLIARISLLEIDDGKVTVPTLAGPRTIDVPPDAKEGTRITLRGFGMPRKRGEPVPLPNDSSAYRGADVSDLRGDQIVELYRAGPLPRQAPFEGAKKGLLVLIVGLITFALYHWL